MKRSSDSRVAPRGDEDRSQGQGGDDAEDEHPLLVFAGYRERRHDDHEDEEVVDGQALFHQVAGEVLAAGSPPDLAGKNQAETPATAMYNTDQAAASL